ncbi:terminase large subunit [Candidatus Saccharibacteria bacterium]|nr:terminase large subunit [Candidatus Saccharibacteria bacterium]
MTNYILEYYQAIKDGTVTVGEYIKLWYAYVIKGIEDKAFFYAPKKAAAAVLFIENYCRHHEGTLGGKKIKLELWQKALVSTIFGIVDEDGKRQFREVFVVIARKNGKTLLAAAISAYCAFLDGEYGGRLYFAAPKLEQASLCFNAFQQIVYTEPTLNALAQKRRTDIYIPESNTTIKPLAFSAKKSDGLNISVCVADEVSSWQGDAGMKFYEVIRSSFGSRTQPLLLNITTAGYVSDGVYDELMKRATRLLKGDSSEKRLAAFLYIIDDPTKWNDINELQKSNPNLNVSVTVDYMLEEITIAEGSLSKKAEFLTKYCNIKQSSSFAWLSAVDVAGISGDALNIENFKNSYCVCGLDLSRTTDLTSVCAVIEKDGILNVFAHFFLPAEKLEEATARDGLPYAIYVKRGFLTLSGDNFVDYNDCFLWLRRLIEEYKIYPLQTGYDRYSSQYLIQDMKAYGFVVDDVFQGYNLSPVIRETEGLIKDRRIRIGDNDLLKIHLLSSALKYEAGTERVKLIKIKANEHIDGTAALLDALCVRQKWYGELGSRLKNEG